MLYRLQEALGLEVKDIALLAGALAFILGLLLLGFSSSRGRRRWLLWLGWLTLLMAVGMLGYGGHRGPSGSGPAA